VYVDLYRIGEVVDQIYMAKIPSPATVRKHVGVKPTRHRFLRYADASPTTRQTGTVTFSANEYKAEANASGYFSYLVLSVLFAIYQNLL
jgi:hypothetical protein